MDSGKNISTIPKIIIKIACYNRLNHVVTSAVMWLVYMHIIILSSVNFNSLRAQKRRIKKIKSRSSSFIKQWPQQCYLWVRCEKGGGCINEAAYTIKMIHSVCQLKCKPNDYARSPSRTKQGNHGTIEFFQPQPVDTAWLSVKTVTMSCFIARWAHVKDKHFLRPEV